jgi:hypothetical protein
MPFFFRVEKATETESSPAKGHLGQCDRSPGIRMSLIISEIEFAV